MAKNSPHFPTEIYPTGRSTVRIEGACSAHRVWLYFFPGSSAVLEKLPASHPFTSSFGRNTLGVRGIGYQVDVVGGNVDFGIYSFPHSKVPVRNVPGVLGLNYQFINVTAPEDLGGTVGVHVVLVEKELLGQEVEVGQMKLIDIVLAARRIASVGFPANEEG